MRESTTRSARILVSIKDQDRGNVGRYAGWGDKEDQQAPAKSEPTGPALAPFLRYRRGDRAWRLALGFMWIPAIIVVLTVEDWLHIPQGVEWISLGVLFVVYVLGVLIADRIR